MEPEQLKQKIKLRQYFKQIKSGLIDISEVPDEYQILLMRYYGI